jgi:hypothetical protein
MGGQVEGELVMKRVAALLGVGLLLAGLEPALRGQVQLESQQLGSEEDFTREYRAARGDLNKLGYGERPFQEKDKKLLEWVAQYHVYRVTCYNTVQRSPKLMLEVHEDLKREIKRVLDNRTKNAEFRKNFAEQLVICFREVMKLEFAKNRLACVHAALMLPELAKLQEPVIGPFLVSVINDPKQHDAVKLYATRALGQFFPAREFMPGVDTSNKDLEDRKKVELAYVDALVSFIHRTWDGQSFADAEAVQFVRKEAIKALAQAQVPAIEVKGKQGKIYGRVAETLLEVLAPKPVLYPPPSLKEKVEAAIGLCQIKISPISLYQPDEAVYRVGKFLVEFGTMYNSDLNLFIGGGKEAKTPALTWKIHGERIKMALADMANNSRGKADDNAKKLSNGLTNYFNSISKYAKIDDLRDLNTTVSGFQPKNAQIFRGIMPAANGDGKKENGKKENQKKENGKKENGKKGKVEKDEKAGNGQ